MNNLDYCHSWLVLEIINFAHLAVSLFYLIADFFFFFFTQGEWKPKQIDNPDYKGKWVHPEIDNPEYEADDNLYRYADFGSIGFDLWQVCYITVTHLKIKIYQ